MSYAQMILLVVLTTLIASMFLAPILWDAASAIEDILNNVYTIDIVVRKP